MFNNEKIRIEAHLWRARIKKKLCKNMHLFGNSTAIIKQLFKCILVLYRIVKLHKKVRVQISTYFLLSKHKNFHNFIFYY